MNHNMLEDIIKYNKNKEYERKIPLSENKLLNEYTFVCKERISSVHYEVK